MTATAAIESYDRRPDHDQLRRALAVADPNVLRLTLYHLTRDPVLAAMRTVYAPRWAGALFTYELADAHHESVRQMAFDHFSANWQGPEDPTLLDRHILRETMELFGHGPLTDDEFEFGVEEAAFDDFPRGVRWTRRPGADVLARYPVLVVGAGITGIAAAVHLEQLGLPYMVVDRQWDVGGAWNANAYPEVRVDSSNMMYQYKFEKRYPWPEFFTSGPGTKEYLRHCARKFGVLDKVRLRTNVTDAIWREEDAAWHVTLTAEDGTTETVRAAFVVSASGLFSAARLPDVPGIESFTGPIVHTTEWSDDLELSGKRVAQIGTGASGAQLMPYLARHAANVTVFQRTANWCLPMEGYRDKVPDDMQWLLQNVPLYWHWFSYAMYYVNAQLEGLQELDPDWIAKGGRVNERNDNLARDMTAFVRERLKKKPELIDKVLPAHPPMARRGTVDNGWYDALLRDNVELVTDPIARVTSNSILTRNGDEHACDLIISAVGFSTTRYVWPATYTGREGATLDDLWGEDGPRAHRGMTLRDFPISSSFMARVRRDGRARFTAWPRSGLATR